MANSYLRNKGSYQISYSLLLCPSQFVTQYEDDIKIRFSSNAVELANISQFAQEKDNLYMSESLLLSALHLKQQRVCLKSGPQFAFCFLWVSRNLDTTLLLGHVDYMILVSKLKLDIKSFLLDFKGIGAVKSPYSNLKPIYQLNNNLLLSQTATIV